LFGLAEISRNSDALKAEQHRESLSLSWWNRENRVLILPYPGSNRQFCWEKLQR
jgi:hypothetical protein